MKPFDEIDDLCVNVIRGLAMDAPQKADSGHPGTAMALAPAAHVLFTRHLKFYPADLNYFDRDRFILSCGHASILIYSLLHLSSAGITLEDLKTFRQWGSKTPGHPEHGLVPGIEVTTGPLGQGIGNAVGMAIAERILRSRLGSDICDHYTYVFCSDGDLMEGISHEAASLAGHLGLGRLIVLYDDNHITIDGPTSLAYSDDVTKRFESYGWKVNNLGDCANDLSQLDWAFSDAKDESNQPKLIILRSHIGWPSPHKTDTSAAHGDPLGKDEILETKKILGLPAEKDFYVPPDTLKRYQEAFEGYKDEYERWKKAFENLSERKKRYFSAPSLDKWEIKKFDTSKEVATRKAIQECLNETAVYLDQLVCGAADLTGNTGVKRPDEPVASADETGSRQIAYGIREHAMGAAMVGMALHKGMLPVGGTFFIFSDYMKPSIRLAALSNAHVIYSFTHDSIGLGQDGPTHQPVEQLAGLRAIPNLSVIRPADAHETQMAWKLAVEADGPVALILSRQALPVLEQTFCAPIEKGAYIVSDAKEPQITLVASGSEVSLCLKVQNELEKLEIASRVVSFPSWDMFENQDEEYKKSVIDPLIPSLSVEALSELGWHKYVTHTYGLNRFGASAPGEIVMDKLGFNVNDIVKKVTEILGKESHD
jgi:transketolase